MHNLLKTTSYQKRSTSNQRQGIPSQRSLQEVSGRQQHPSCTQQSKQILPAATSRPLNMLPPHLYKNSPYPKRLLEDALLQ